MKLLFDQNLSHRLIDRLADLFPGSTQARLVELDRAYAIVSGDVDLAEMATLHGPPPLVIWLRGGNSSTAAVEVALRTRHGEIIAAAGDRQTACVEVVW